MTMTMNTTLQRVDEDKKFLDVILERIEDYKKTCMSPETETSLVHRLRRAINFEMGKKDRLIDAGCLNANGAYLTGYYYDQFGSVFDNYYMDKA